MKTYRIGVIEESPVNGATVGGLHFPRHTEKVSGYGAQTKRDRIPGSIVQLDNAQIERVKAESQFKVIRVNRNSKGDVRRAQIHDKRTRRFRPQPNDLPVGDYIYIEEINENPHVSISRTPISGGGDKDDKRAASEATRRRRRA